MVKEHGRAKVVKARTYRIEGEIRKAGEVVPFSREIMAVKREDVLEIVYSEMGSRHRAKRREIFVRSVRELKPEEIVNPLILKIKELEAWRS